MNNLNRNLVENYKQHLNEGLLDKVVLPAAVGIKNWLTAPGGIAGKVVDPLARVFGSASRSTVKAVKAGRAAVRLGIGAGGAYLGAKALGIGDQDQTTPDFGPSRMQEPSGRLRRESRKEAKRREALTRGLELSAAAEAGSPEELIAAKVGTSNRARAIAANVQKEKIKRLKAAGKKKGDPEYDAAVGALSTVRPITGPLVTRQRPGKEGMIDRTAGYVNPNSPEARVIADIKSGALDPSVLRTSEPSHQRAIKAVEAAGKKVPLEITRQEIERRGEKAAQDVAAKQRAADRATKKRIETAVATTAAEIDRRKEAEYKRWGERQEYGKAK